MYLECYQVLEVNIFNYAFVLVVQHKDNVVWKMYLWMLYWHFYPSIRDTVINSRVNFVASAESRMELSSNVCIIHQGLANKHPSYLSVFCTTFMNWWCKYFILLRVGIIFKSWTKTMSNHFNGFKSQLSMVGSAFLEGKCAKMLCSCT